MLRSISIAISDTVVCSTYQCGLLNYGWGVSRYLCHIMCLMIMTIHVYDLDIITGGQIFVVCITKHIVIIIVLSLQKQLHYWEDMQGEVDLDQVQLGCKKCTVS